MQDTGERRRAGDAPLSITDLIDEETVQSIAQEAWSALVGDDEFLVPLPGEHPDDADQLVGRGRRPLDRRRRPHLPAGRPPRSWPAACSPSTLPRCSTSEDVDDGLGELANVVGGNVKAVLPGPSVLGLPEVGSAPAAGPDTCRVDLLWRGQSLTISVQGSAGAPLDQ